MFKKHRKKLLKLLAICLFLIPVNIILYKILSPRINAFGCFDDCFNYLGGYFMLNGKQLYSQIWFNHQPFMAYLSFFIQLFSHPTNIFELVLKHRQFVFLIAFAMDALIIYRFGLAGVGFTLLYEFSKFYIFGDRFLAEGIVVYFLVFMIGLSWSKLNNKNLTIVDYLLSGIFTWLVLFTREPYALVALLIYAVILANKTQWKYKISSLIIFLLLNLIGLFTMPIKDWVFQVFTINGGLLFFHDTQSNTSYALSLSQIFFYPLYLFFDGVWNLFRNFILGLDIVFLMLILVYYKINKKIPLILIFGLFLGFANLRFVPPGLIFYGAFHLIPWYGMFIFTLLLMLKDIFEKDKRFALSATVVLGILFGYILLSPDSYTREKIIPQEEFITNYGNILQVGEVVRLLSTPSDTLFLDGADDLIYWQAKRMSLYKYSWYTSVMPLFPIYTKARLDMFTSNPPDFYYASCIKGKPQSFPPKNAISLYQPLYSYGKPTCLYIKKSIIPQISEERWKAAKDFKYELPKG